MLPAYALAALVIAISSSAEVSPTLVDHVVVETNTIWKPAGLTIVWQRDDGGAAPALRVIIGPLRGSTLPRYVAPLGWIEFDDGRPQPHMYLSYANAMTLLEASRGVVGLVSRMPILERETFLGRALGRALAHEVGHYLLAERAHTATGLMKASFSSAELFMPETRHFAINDTQRAIVLARLDRVPLVASSAISGSSSPTSPPPASQPRAAARWSGPTPH